MTAQNQGTTENDRELDRVTDAGVTHVEVASFVNPKRVPQMAGAEDQELLQEAMFYGLQAFDGEVLFNDNP